MQRVKVYYFTMYDIRADEVVVSRRPASLETILRFGGTLIEDSAEEVDREELDENGLLRM